MTELVRVQLAQGGVTGVKESKVCRFDAIPYGQAPIGALRFKAPMPAEWQGELDATRPGPVPPQLPSRLRLAMGDFHASQSEDCLKLTVWTPGVDTKRRPVVVWLHGGAWQSGGGALDWYDGIALAAWGDVVVVSPNYRLAALGWLAVSGETANVGLLDMELSLQWVRENISSFGGDPERITVMGQSAGALSIACLLTRQPVFERAIIQSAPFGRGVRSAEAANEVSMLYLKAAGVDSVEAARDLPVESLLRAQMAPELAEWLKSEGAHRSLFCPVADGVVIPKDIDAALHRAAGRADVMVGSNRDEMSAFFAKGFNQETHALGNMIYGDASRNWASVTSSMGRKAWAYVFQHRFNEQFGACHCIEIPFVFGTTSAFDDAPMLKGITQDDVDTLTEAIQQAWLSFIRDGHPGWLAWPHEHVFE